ncbi:hypothetical protein Y032_0318g2353 [Ancylostoma ceylanicum]|nr:hypothetical protein Y032_0318g2353 [Ancylostoma ceylanicum]
MKRHKKTGDSLQVSASDFEEAVSLLREDESIPPYMKTLFGILLEEREVHAKKEAEQLQRNPMTRKSCPAIVQPATYQQNLDLLDARSLIKMNSYNTAAIDLEQGAAQGGHSDQ